MLERVITALRDGGADPVVVVTGPHDPALPSIARSAGAEVCELAEPTPDMRATVEHGLRWLQERHNPQPDDAFLLTPGDLPFLDAATIERLCETWRNRPPATILIPRHGTSRGHPALIGWRHVEAIRPLPSGVGIDSYLRECADATLDVAVPGECSSLDVNSPGDLHSALSAEEIVRERAKLGDRAKFLASLDRSPHGSDYFEGDGV
jgi:CTP:molybdopterin cytidylyltransferase MocA